MSRSQGGIHTAAVAWSGASLTECKHSVQPLLFLLRTAGAAVAVTTCSLVLRSPFALSNKSIFQPPRQLLLTYYTHAARHASRLKPHYWLACDRHGLHLPFCCCCPPSPIFLWQRQHHPLMVKERAGSSVRPLHLAYMIYGGRAAFERKTAIQAQMEADPVFDK